MNIWSDKQFTAEVVRRYLDGDGPSEIARCFDLTRNRVLSKMQRLGHARKAASTPGVAAHKVAGHGAALQASRDAAKAFPRAQAVPTQADRILVALADGPKTVLQLAPTAGLTAKAVATAVAGLMHMGKIERRNFGRRFAIYGLRAEGDDSPKVFRGDVARRAEEAYVSARKAGRSKTEAADALDLAPTTAIYFEEAFRQQTTSFNSGDNSCPKFADHDRHIAALANVGAYPVMPTLADLRRCL
jgi:hypothetical protein